jgi:hypothetical protein
MQDDLAVADGGAQLSQVERVVDTFIAPSKTFTDIRRSAACWLPIVLMIVLCTGWTWTVGKTVGFAAAMETQLTKNPKQAEQMQTGTPAEQASKMKIGVIFTKVIMYAIPAFILIALAFEALILWASFNFGLGATTKYSQVFAVLVFAGLPRYLVWIMSIIMMFAGVGTDNLDTKNPVGTNLGYYLSDSPHWMQTAGQFFDIFSLWTLALIVIGMAIISRKKISQAATIVLGWWVLALIGFTVAAAL